MKRRVALFSVVVCLGLMTAPLEAAKLTVLHVNDTHGHLWDEKTKGGVDVMARMVEKIRQEVSQEGGHVLFLHAGDFNTGVPESNLLHALPDLSMLRTMGCDALALGNHEFDNPQVLLRFQRDFARFPFLSANFVDAQGRRPFDAYKIFDYGDVTVAVLGLTTEETAQAEPTYLDGAHFQDVVQIARSWVPKLASQADVVIALGHLGWERPINVGAGSKELAEARIPGLDIIVDGHSHTLFEKAEKVGDALVVQAGSYGRHLGRFDLDVENGTIVSWDWTAIPMETSMARDPEATAKLEYFLWQGSRKTREPLGSATVDLDGKREHVRSGETNLSRMGTDALREMANADVALLNGGGIRDSIPAGPVSLRDALSVFPFGNDVVTFDLSGEEVLSVLKAMAAVPVGAGAFPHVSGLSCRFSGRTISDVTVGGAPLDMDKTYRFATLSYLASGGDGYTVFKTWTDRMVNTGYKDVDAFAAYVKRHSPLSDTADQTARIARE